MLKGRLLIEANTLTEKSINEGKKIKITINDRDLSKLPFVKTLENALDKIAFIRSVNDEERYNEAVKTLSIKVLDAYKEIENLSLDAALKSQ